MPTRAATVLAAMASIAVASPALAWPFGGAKTAATPAPAAASTGAGAQAATPAAATPAKSFTMPPKAPPAQRAAMAQQDPVTQVAFWTREFTIDPSDAEAGAALAHALRVMGRPMEAIDAAQKVLATHPTYAPALMEVARSQLSLGHGFYAIRPLQTVASADPKDAKPWTLLGMAYEQNEQPDLAQNAYDTALKISPNDPAALSNYALFRATHGDAPSAETMLRKAVAQPTAGAAERQNLALVLGLQGKMGEAERLIRQDLPPELADSNLAYLRSLSGGPQASTPRSWSAVKASEMQIKSPS